MHRTLEKPEKSVKITDLVTEMRVIGQAGCTIVVKFLN